MPELTADTLTVLLDAKEQLFAAQKELGKSDDPRAFNLRRSVARVIGQIDDCLEDK